MSPVSRAMAGWLGALAVGAGYVGLAAPAEPARASIRPASSVAQGQTPVSGAAPSADNPHRAVINQYCAGCHNDRTNRSSDPRLKLNQLPLDQVGPDAELWERVVRKVRSGTMPPSGARRPDQRTLNALAAYLENSIDQFAGGKPNPGRPSPHRLNRFEYSNAVRDLLAMEIDGRSMLPTDESGYGFDNIADVLSVTPGLLERYMFAAQKISRLAVADTTMRPVTEIFKVRAWPTLEQNDRMSDDLPFRSRGGTAVRHFFPVDGEYSLRIRMQRDFANNGIMGIENRERLDVRLDGTQIKLFNVGGECVGSNEPRCIAPPGVQMNYEYEMTADDALQVRFKATAGSHLIGVSFTERTAAVPEGAGGRPSSDMAVAAVELQGPLNVTGLGESPSRQRVFVCQPKGTQDEEPCARRILATLARHAYRRPVADTEVQALLGFYKTGRAEGSFDAGIRFGLERILVSPNFLFRIEREPANVAVGTPYRITDLELASRLSFFLWSSIPDDELIDVAALGKLKDPKVLEQQVRRMLADPRAKQSLITNFAAQWLMLRDLQALHPNPEVFPEFNDNLRRDFQRETELFLEDQLREDHSLANLLTANYTFVNERLAKFYGIRNIYGEHFRRVTLPAATHRAGLLSQGSLLTVTSYPDRTSPVVRGKYILSNILGSPPPPPPPNVPALDVSNGPVPTSVRERMQKHRTNPVCASCHTRMDPLGFALENFNGIGKWREFDGKTLVDASGTFPDGSKFGGPDEFRSLLVKETDSLVRTLTEKLLTYALGRGAEYYDMPAVRRIIKDAEPDLRWSSIILGVAKSTPFQMRAAQDRSEDRKSDVP